MSCCQRQTPCVRFTVTLVEQRLEKIEQDNRAFSSTLLSNAQRRNHTATAALQNVTGASQVAQIGATCPPPHPKDRAASLCGTRI